MALNILMVFVRWKLKLLNFVMESVLKLILVETISVSDIINVTFIFKVIHWVKQHWTSQWDPRFSL